MNKKSILVLLFQLFLFVHGNGQSYQKTNEGVAAITASLNVDFRFYSPSIVRILKSPSGSNFNKESLSVIKTPQKTTFSVKQKGNIVTLKSESIAVSLDLASGSVMFNKVAGTPLLREKDGSTKFTPFDDAGNKTFTVFQAFQSNYSQRAFHRRFPQRIQSYKHFYNHQQQLSDPNLDLLRLVVSPKEG